MPTINRPFFANFFAAFRAHSALQKPTSPTVLTHKPSSSSLAASITTASTPRVIPNATQSASKPPHHHHQTTATSAAVAAAASQHFQSSRHHLSSTTRSSPPQPSTTTTTMGTRHHSAGGSASPFQRSRTPSLTRPTRPPQRRNTDPSSSESGFLTAGKERWYIGGTTAQGEERFYNLGMVRSYKSCDRLSLDRLSL